MTMREIKVRGYSTEKLCADSQWVEGTGVHTTLFTEEFAKEVGKPGETFIFTEQGWFEVYPKSVSQSTGLKEKNGVEIYEGDIVHFVDFDNTGGLRGDREHTGIVKYQSGIYEIWKNNDSEYYGSDGAFILNHAWLQDDEFEVIGNIYEHPHLLEVQS